MKILRLMNGISSTSAPFNQFTLGFRHIAKQVVCCYFPPKNNKNFFNKFDTNDNIEIHSGNSSIIGVLGRLIKILNDNKFDVIHVHNGHMGIFLLIAQIISFRNYCDRLIFTFHTNFKLLKLRNKCFICICFLFSKYITVVSRSSFDSIPKWVKNIKKDKILVIRNGFDNDRIKKTIKSDCGNEYFSKKDGIKIVSVGALNDNKNIVNLVKILIANVKLQCHLIILGDGAKRIEIDSLVDKNLNNKIKISILGKVSRKRAIMCMNEADIHISLSKGEGMPIGVLESMSLGCYNILSNIAAHSEISAPIEMCRLIEANNPLELIEALNNYANLSEDFIEINRKKIINHVNKNFELSKMVYKYNDLFYKIVN